MPEPCEECERPMSATAVVCPHCGHRQSERDVVDPGLVGPKKPKKLSLSGDEAAALLAVSGVARVEAATPRGPMALVLPRETSSGVVWALEWILALVALPLLLGMFSIVVFSPRTMRRVSESGEGALTLGAGLLGGIGFFVSLLGLGIDATPAAWWVGIAAAALVARLALRASGPRRDDGFT